MKRQQKYYKCLPYFYFYYYHIVIKIKQLGLCFSATTTFLDASYHVVEAPAIKTGDMIHTLSENGSIVDTKVKLAIKQEGAFDFVNIRLRNIGTNITTDLTVTDDHEVMILGGGEGADAGKSQNTPAKQVIPGNKMTGIGIGKHNSVWKVERVVYMKMASKYVIQTEAGTALASQILTTTSCAH